PLGPRFWTLLCSSASSNLADGALKTAFPLIALRHTDSPLMVSGIVFALTLPWLLFAIPVGILIDSVDRRIAMLASNAIRVTVLALLALALASEIGSIWVLYATAFAIGTVETAYDTSAQSVLPGLVH